MKLISNYASVSYFFKQRCSICYSYNKYKSCIFCLCLSAQKSRCASRRSHTPPHLQTKGADSHQKGAFRAIKIPKRGFDTSLPLVLILFFITIRIKDISMSLPPAPRAYSHNKNKDYAAPINKKKKKTFQESTHTDIFSPFLERS
jgi:hypothetical protein